MCDDPYAEVYEPNQFEQDEDPVQSNSVTTAEADIAYLDQFRSHRELPEHHEDGIIPIDIVEDCGLCEEMRDEGGPPVLHEFCDCTCRTHFVACQFVTGTAMWNAQQWVDVLRECLGITGYSILANLRYADEHLLFDMLRELMQKTEDGTLGQALVLASSFKRVRPRLYAPDSDYDY